MSATMNARRRPSARAPAGSAGSSPESAASAAEANSPQRRVARVWILRHADGENAVERLGQLGPPLRGARGRLLHVRPQHLRLPLPVERRLRRSGTRRARRRASTGRPARRSGRARIASGAMYSSVPDELPGARQAAAGGDVLRQPEVAQVRVPGLVEEHVGRLHVPVDEPARMGSVERVRHLGDDSERARRLERAPSSISSFRSEPST